MAKHHRHDEFTLHPMAAEFTYDLNQLLAVAHLLTVGDKVGWAENNARVESFMIRFRTLLEFFYKPANRPTDVRAWEYVKEADEAKAQARWIKARPEATLVFGVDEDWLAQAVIVRVGHASLDRLYQMTWPAQFMAIGMARVWAAFLDEARDEYRQEFESRMHHVIQVMPEGGLSLEPKP